MVDKCPTRRTYLKFSTVAVSLTSGCLGLGSSASSSGQGGPTADVTMTAESFEPESLTIRSGTSVLWHNTSDRRHTVTAYEEAIPAEAEYFASGGFDSENDARFRYRGSDSPEKPIPGGAMNEGETYAQVLDVAGTYEYFCVPHEDYGMTGQVVVEDG